MFFSRNTRPYICYFQYSTQEGKCKGKAVIYCIKMGMLQGTYPLIFCFYNIRGCS